MLEAIACHTDAHRAPMCMESRDGTAKGTWEIYSKFSSLSLLTSQANTTLKTALHLWLSHHSLLGCGKGKVLGRTTLQDSGVCHGAEVTSHNWDFLFFFFFPPEFDLPLTYLWQLQRRRTDKINNAHISGLLWNWNLLKLIEHVGIWYIELLAKKLTFMRVYNGILDLNDHLSARKSR